MRLVILSVIVWAVSAGAAPLEKPTSQSYVNLTACFPEIQKPEWAQKVDLDALKAEIDRLFVSAKSVRRFRQVILKDPKGERRRLTLSLKPKKKKSGFDEELTLEQLDAQGAGTPLPVPASQQMNPKQRELDEYFVNQEVVQDDSSYFDTKLKGMDLAYKRYFQEIYELELRDPRRKRRLLCTDARESGVVCTCFHK